MTRKWLAFPLSAGLLIVFGIAVSPAFSRAADDEGPLGKLMEKVNKANSSITKATRNKVNFAKSQKDVEKYAKELVKLGKEAKPMKDAVEKVKKKVADAQKKWDDYIDEFIKTSEKLGEIAASSAATQTDAKGAFDKVKKTCVDCHTDFRPEEGSF